MRQLLCRAAEAGMLWVRRRVIWTRTMLDRIGRRRGCWGSLGGTLGRALLCQALQSGGLAGHVRWF